jgi:thiol-disulfide isomerase/thioredoxin
MKLHRLATAFALCALASSASGQDSAKGTGHTAGAGDFCALYATVKAKHQVTFHDLRVDMKSWAPFVAQTLRDNDFSGFTSEQLLRLLNLNLFSDVPGPADDEPLKAFVAMVEERPARDPYDALLKLSIAPQSAKLSQNAEQISRLYDTVMSKQALKELLGGPHAETLLTALVYYVPRSVLKARAENARELAGALPRSWPAGWATLGEPLVQTLFTEAAVGDRKRETLRRTAVDAMDRYLKKEPTGRTSDFVRLSRQRLTGAAAQGKLIGSYPKGLTFEWSTDPNIKKLADLRGRVVVLDFWATWCGPCIKSIPEVVALQKEFSSFPVTILGVTSLQGYVAGLEKGQLDTAGKPDEERELTRKLMDKLGMTWPTVFTKEAVYNPEFGIEGIPFTAILDPAGRVRFSSLHPKNDHARIRQYLIDLLKEAGLDHP